MVQAGDRTFSENVSDSAIRNIMRRNPRLPRDLVERFAKSELSNAQQVGRLFTAKEVAEIEDRVYEQVNVKINYGDQKRKILNNTHIDKGGVFNSGRTASSYGDRFAPKPRAGSTAGNYRRNMFLNSGDARQNANNTIASNYQTTISKVQAMQNVTNYNYGFHE